MASSNYIRCTSLGSQFPVNQSEEGTESLEHGTVNVIIVHYQTQPVFNRGQQGNNAHGVQLRKHLSQGGVQIELTEMPMREKKNLLGNCQDLLRDLIGSGGA